MFRFMFKQIPVILAIVLITSSFADEQNGDESAALIYLKTVATYELEAKDPKLVTPPANIAEIAKPWRFLILAKQDIIRANFDSALNYLQTIVLEFVTHPASDYAKGYFGEIYSYQGKTIEARQTLATIIKQIQIPEIRSEFEYIYAQNLYNSKPAKALEIAEHNYMSSVSSEARNGWALLAEEVIDRGFSFSDVRLLYEEKPDDYCFKGVLSLKLAKIYLHINEYEPARKMALDYLQKYSLGKYTTDAEDIIEFPKELTGARPGSFGVLLPLSGKYGDYGHKVLTAMKLSLLSREALEDEMKRKKIAQKALREAKSEKRDTKSAEEALKTFEITDGYEISGKNFRFIFRDSGADAVIVEKALEELVRKDKVIAILGPLFSATSEAAAYKAEELGVPLMALSRKEDITNIGRYVFRNCLTSKLQADMLANYMINRMNMKRFAILAPEHSYGLEMARLFWDAVEKNGGEIRGYETYEQDAKTFSGPIKRIVGRYYLEARKEFQNQKWLKLKDLKGYKRSKELEKIAKNLKPVIDFDALFVPDYYQTVSLVAPAVAFEDVILYTESKWYIDRIRKSTGRWDLEMVRLIGGSGWNSPQLIERGQRYVRNSIFVDGFYPKSEEPETAKFVTDYRMLFGKNPNIVEAQAYESAALFAYIAKQLKPESRPAFKNALLNIKDYQGVTGKLSFDKNGEVQKQLFVLTVDGDRIRLMDEVLEEKEKENRQKAGK